MNAEIIAVGSEMLTPDKVDTNSLHLTKELNTLGIEVVAKCIIGDDRARLTDAVAVAWESVDLVILTGGLGPTEDDLTREAAAAALGVGMTENAGAWQAILNRFERFGRVPTANNRRQAMILDGAEMLPNPNGTAPGQWFQRDGRVLVMLPGPPRELKPMTAAELMPRLAALLPPQVIRTHWYRVSLVPESELDALIAPIYSRYTNPVTTILAAAGDIDIHLRARSAMADEAESLLQEVGSAIQAVLGDRIYSTNGDGLEAVVGALLRARGQTMAVAESITGGMLGEQITSIPGSSDYFLGGILAYSDAMKHQLLGVPLETLREHTAVSEECARAMAAGARSVTGADYALAVTGYADASQAGLVWVGLATPTHVHARKLQLTGDRHRVRSMTVVNALDWLRRALLS
ncbi:MAG TPA: competence/damage-inducible protein A [Bryobacteraceae bacterium]|nr:competence/damage-inducible protein A [Bryobacteraceae bacterium]